MPKSMERRRIGAPAALAALAAGRKRSLKTSPQWTSCRRETALWPAWDWIQRWGGAVAEWQSACWRPPPTAACVISQLQLPDGGMLLMTPSLLPAPAPLQLYPLLIGQGGRTRKRIEDDTGARIAFPSRSAQQQVGGNITWWMSHPPPRRPCLPPSILQHAL